MKKGFVLISSAVLAASLNAQVEVTGKITHESAAFTHSGRTVGNTVSHNNGSVAKAETNARVYVDGESGDATYHVELQGYVNTHDGSSENNKSFTQREVLREAYVDTNVNDWAIRAGKQQVVWGKADGYKALDLINPTDYSEMAQNQMEDSRIPTFMINAEKYNDDGSSVQVVLSQPRENIFAGLNRSIKTTKRTNSVFEAGSYTSADPSNAENFGAWSGNTSSLGHDKGSPFILKGVDTITGAENGFLNIVPDLGSISALFGRAFNFKNTDDQGGLNDANHANNAGRYFNVGTFNSTKTLWELSDDFDTMTGGDTFGDLNFGETGFWLADTDEDGVYGEDYTGQQTLAGFAAKFDTNLLNTDSKINSTFEYMDRTSFSTFDTFVNANSKYVYDMPSDTDANLALRYNNTKDGLNYSFVYSYNYDTNPVIKVDWVNKNGAVVERTRGTTFKIGPGQKDNSAVISLTGIGGHADDANGETETEFATLRFTETLKRAHNLGVAADYAIDSEAFGPVVVRAEGLYQKDVYSPVIDRGALAIGDITKALVMKPGDKFKYVLGADFTFDTDTMISGQFIQERNLDYVDSNKDFDGTACSDVTFSAYTSSANCGVYTADFAAMHMKNGLKKAEKNKNFYSLYISKPFGESKQHRWNNILMLEENGGRWNRLDAEYSLNDTTQLTAEYNKYWGNEDTQFGQLADSSNVQVGVKVSF